MVYLATQNYIEERYVQTSLDAADQLRRNHKYDVMSLTQHDVNF